ncbi:MAG: hypothetical protein EOP41_03420 [Sphingobacteriaceae bacterium]|nr:MAG: hypothetical protein EOP41_03420 [Sphingobacteriaceae bacterium]
MFLAVSIVFANFKKIKNQYLDKANSVVLINVLFTIIYLLYPIITRNQFAEKSAFDPDYLIRTISVISTYIIVGIMFSFKKLRRSIPVTLFSIITLNIPAYLYLFLLLYFAYSRNLLSSWVMYYPVGFGYIALATGLYFAGIYMLVTVEAKRNA